jgi:uncharacterized protein (TIGR03382 family)
MRSALRPLFAAALTLAGSLTAAHAAFLVTATGTLNLTGGADTMGLDGAQFTVTALFPEGNYADDSGYPVAMGDASQTFLQISDASNAAFNGIFGHFAGNTSPVYFPTTSGISGGSADNWFLYFDLVTSDAFIGLGLDTAPTPSGTAVGVGDTIELSHFSNGGSIIPRSLSTETYFNSGFGQSTESNYDISSGSFSVVVIPEPSVVALGGLGLVFLFRRRR